MSHRMTAVAVLVLMLALTGCVRYRTDAVVSDHGTVSGSIVMGYTRETIQLAKQLSGPSADAVGELKAAVDANVRSISAGTASAKPYAKDGFTGFETTFTDIPLADLAKVLRHEQTDSGLDVKLEQSGSTYTFSVEAPRKPGQIELPAEAFAGADVTLVMTFPGPVTDTNGDLSGNTVTWKIQLHQPPPRVYATALAAAPTSEATAAAGPEPQPESAVPAASNTPGEGGPPWIVWAIGGVLLLVGACVVTVFVRRAPR